MSDLVDLLRATPLTHGRICLLVMDGKWRASVSHFNGRMTHPFDETCPDPVSALEWALRTDNAAQVETDDFEALL